MRALLAALALLLASCTAAAEPQPLVAAVEPDPVTCSGYPEPRLFMEPQDWWTPIPGLPGATTGHVHLGLCFPTQTVTGVVRFDFVVRLHDNLGTLTRVKMQDDTSKDWIIIKPNEEATGGDDVFTYRVDFDTAQMLDGWRLFRVYADVLHQNGNRQTARAGWPLDVENGKTDSNKANPAQWKFQNWYRVASPARDWGYTGPILTPKPGGVMGIKCTTSTGVPIDRTFVHADPNFHAGDPGTVLLDRAGAYNGDVSVPAGTRRLVVRCQQVDGAETHEGVGNFPMP